MNAKCVDPPSGGGSAPQTIASQPTVGWEWYKRYNADCLRIVAGLDYAGCSLSNYGEPLYTLWHDVDWHYTSNAYLLETGVA